MSEPPRNDASTDERGDPQSIERAPRPTVEPPRSVLQEVSERTGEAPRVSLREEDSAEGGAPPIDPRSDERSSLPSGRNAYQVLGEIARGGMGVVLRAHDTDLGRDVAMKVLTRHLADRPDVLQRFVEEAQIGGQLQHPGIVPVYELGLMADERPYFTMKLVKGQTLAMLLAERPDPTADRRRLLDVFLSVCRTVAYAHSRGVIHRDLKPANVMVGKFGEVQVVDWGLAKVLARGGVADERKAREERSELTLLETVRSDGSGSGTDSMVGSVLGTPAYMPPEQASGQVDRLDERTDVFALGAILCELLTGVPPYGAESDETLMHAAQGELDEAYARLDACDADPELVKLARQCLVAAKQARPRNAGVVADALEAHLASVEERAQAAVVEAAEARVHAAEERRARRLTFALAAAVTGLLLVGGGGLLWMERTKRDELERIERGLEDVQTRVAALRDDGREADALEMARTALALVEGRPDGDFLAARANRLVEETRSATERAEADRRRIEETLARERAAAKRDADFLARLDELSVKAIQRVNDAWVAEADEAFAAAFTDWGVDLTGDIETAMTTLRESGLALEIAPVLDTWASLRRRRFGNRSFEAQDLNAIAADLDPDALRNELREALIDEQTEVLLAIAKELPEEELTLGTASLLGNGLIDLEQHRAALSLLQRAITRFPDDVGLRIQAVQAAGLPGAGGLPELARIHLAAATALRPDLAELSAWDAHLSYATLRLPAAVRAARRAIAAGMDEPQTWQVLAQSCEQLGRHEEAVAAMTRFEELGGDIADGKNRMTRDVSLHLSGAISYEEFQRRNDEAMVITPPGTGALLACTFHGVEPRIEAQQLVEIEESLASTLWIAADARVVFALVRAEALLMLGDPERALRSCDIAAAERTGETDATGLEVELGLRTRALFALGRQGEARATFEHLEAQLLPVLAEDPDGWRDSDLPKLVEELRALVGE